MTDYPKMPTDPRNREELKGWIAKRAKARPNEPLDAREAIMVRSLQSRRPPYSIT